MTSPQRVHLWRGVLRQTGRDPAWLGYWLKRHRRTEDLRPARLASLLGLELEGLIVLSLCRTPQPGSFAEDLAVICRRTGADEVALARILRQEQALSRWAEGAPSSQGWLMAASDAVPQEEGEEPEGPAEDCEP